MVASVVALRPSRLASAPALDLMAAWLRELDAAGRSPATMAGKQWRVRLYAPTPGAPRGRVTFIEPGQDKPRTRTPDAKTGQTLDDLFDQIEGRYDRGVAVGGQRGADGRQVRDMAALGRLYLERLEKRKRSEGYISNRKSILNKWVNPTVGEVLVANWSSEDSQDVLNVAAGSVGKARLNDIRSTLSGMRATAHAKRAGGRWLDPLDNPLEDCEVPSSVGEQAVSDKYVPVQMRPSLDMVDKAIAAAGEVTSLPWFDTCVEVGARTAARLGEQLALRAIDIDFRQMEVDINGSWTVARKAEKPDEPRRRWRKNTKNDKRRHAPLYGSQRDRLLRECRRALGLSPEAPEEQVVQLIEAERERRANLARTGNWRDYVADPHQEPWLFPDESGLPPTKERFNDVWHRVRDASGWDARIPYKNLRHHAILRWKSQMPELGWEELAVWSGHDHRTLLAYYVIPGKDRLDRGRAALRTL